MNDAEDQTPSTRERQRRRGFLWLGAIILIGLVGWGVYRLFFVGNIESTEDAYVAGDVVAITARERGIVVALHADDTERVKAGQTLVELDPSSADAAMAAAEANLALSVRKVRARFLEVDAARTEITHTQAELQRATNDLSRRKAAAADGAVSGEEVAHAADAVTTARAALTLARSRLAQAEAAVQGTGIETNPDVLAAVAAFRQAAIVQGHMHLASPIDGIVAQRSVQIGQQVAAGTRLMAVVPLHEVWVDANFRETQLKDLRIGQPATVIADIYGKDIVFHGRVAGLSAGSGSAFALLPPQNASGNWIKITQRLPVRIALDAAELEQYPLRIGLSATVKVDVSDSSGAPVARQAGSASRTWAGAVGGSDVDARIAKIIAANRGGATQ